MKGFVKETARLLKKHGLFYQTLAWDFMIIFFAVFAVISLDVVNLLIMALFALLANWNVSDVYKDESISLLKHTCEDFNDKLCLAEHEVERLKLEFETVQAALQEKSRPNNIEDAALAEVPNPRPKRRPVPKRKPKTENVNENKD